MLNLIIYILKSWRQRHPTPVLLPGKSHGWRSLVGCSPWGCYESDTTERLHFQFSLSCIGGGNGNPLQCSCLENPRDGGAWWAAVYGVAQSRTRLKRLSSSSSRSKAQLSKMKRLPGSISRSRPAKLHPQVAPWHPAASLSGPGQPSHVLRLTVSGALSEEKGCAHPGRSWGLRPPFLLNMGGLVCGNPLD